MNETPTWGPAECRCGSENARSDRHGHPHLAWCAKTTEIAERLHDQYWLKSKADHIASIADAIATAAAESRAPVEAKARFAELFQKAARDETLSDHDVRCIVKYLSMAPLSERDIARSRELAERFGWQ